ncbi:response regulator [Neorhizobium galegae]|uniref:Response regulator n=1 Tax=Neorhizobium galegae TaxID=399 RepID=A0A6A1TYY4_NEOGA|nr:response regulator [Neorhizobium galegae]
MGQDTPRGGFATSGLDQKIDIRTCNLLPSGVRSLSASFSPGGSTLEYRFLIVEDSLLVAMDIEDAIHRSGHDVVGIAPDMTVALNYTRDTDIAFVDVRLADGETGPEIAKTLAECGIVVIMITGNPGLVAAGVSGVLGVMAKPLTDQASMDLIQFAVDRKNGRPGVPPARLRLFH